MRYKEPRAMRDIHKIQERIYEEQKNMTDEEKLEALHREVEEAEKKYSFKLRNKSKSRA